MLRKLINEVNAFSSYLLKLTLLCVIPCLGSPSFIRGWQPPLYWDVSQQREEDAG